jgi:alpha 1,3-mannosyltransferase
MGRLSKHESDLTAHSTDTAEVDEDDEEPPRRAHLVSHHSTPPSRPENYTVCSPQLLHFDQAGKPLWLNGWLGSDKYADSLDIDVSAFEVFIKETPKLKASKEEMWRVQGANVCCLTAATFTEISEEGKQVLEMIASLVRQIDRTTY